MIDMPSAASVVFECDLKSALNTHTNMIVSACPVQSFYINVLQILGLFPYSSKIFSDLHQNSKKIVKQSMSKSLLLWSAMLWLAMTFTVAVYTNDFIGFYSNELEELEFFTAITSVFRLSVILHAPFTALYMAYKSRYIPHLLQDCQQSVTTIFTLSGQSQIRPLWTFTYFVLTWTLVSAIMGVLAQVMAINSSTVLIPNFNWYTVDDCIFGLVRMPTYASASWFSVCHFITVFYEVAPQMLAMILTFTTAVGFGKVAANLEAVTGLAPAMRRTRFENCRCNYVRLQLLQSRTNKIFSVFLLTGCLRDVITFVAFIATLLRTRDQAANETTVNYQKRIAEDDCLWIYVYLFALIALINTFVRTGVSIYCQEKSDSIRQVLQEISAESTMDNEFRQCCRQLKVDIGQNEKDIVSAALFSVTKEYITAIGGLIVTYFLLIYQTRDSKMELQELLKAQEFRKDFSLILEHILKSNALLSNSSRL